VKHRVSLLQLTIAALAILTCTCQVSDSKPTAKAHAKPSTSRPAPAAAPAKGGALNAAYAAYINRLRGKLDSKWYLADGRNHVVIILNVDPNGSVTNLNITSSPTNTQAEQAANDAFNQSQPLEGLPGGSPAVKLAITFDSVADPHGDNSRQISAQIDPLTPAAPANPPASSTDTK
jgi:TonB family protein